MRGWRATTLSCGPGQVQHHFASRQTDMLRFLSRQSIPKSDLILDGLYPSAT